MTHANRLSRGDLRRNARLERLRGVVSHDRVVLAVDLADDKQVVILTPTTLLAEPLAARQGAEVGAGRGAPAGLRRRGGGL